MCAPSSPAITAVSSSSFPTPLFGGTLHAFPFVLVLSSATNSQGALQVPFTWPQAATPGLSLWFQMGVFDPSAQSSFALSNGLKGTTP